MITNLAKPSQTDPHAHLSAVSDHTASSGQASNSQQSAASKPAFFVGSDGTPHVTGMKPGDILVRVEDPPESDDHLKTQQLQRKPNLNGIKDNKGSAMNVHALIWTKTEGNPGNKQPRGMGEPQVADARGEHIRRVQGTAIQPGTYMVYRPKDGNLGDWAAQVGMLWADQGKVHYSTTELIKAGKGNDSEIKFDDVAKKNAAQYAKDAFTSDPVWAKNDPMTNLLGAKGVKGAICSSFVSKTYQAAQLNIDAAKAAENGKPPSFEELAEKLPGWLANNPSGVSPRTLEHLLLTSKDAKGDPQFESLGELKVTKALYGEQAFPPESTVPAMPKAKL